MTPSSRTAGASRSIAAGLAAVVLFAATAAWWSWPPLAPPDERVPDDPAGHVASEAPRGDVVVPVSEPERIAADVATAIRGFVCNADGTRLPGLEVQLVREGVRPLPPGVLDLKNTTGREYPSQRTSSGADGSFAFADLEPATYHVKLWLHQRVRERVDLAAGETRHVELRFDEPQTLLVGHVTSGGGPLARAHLELFVGKDYLTHGVTDRNGDYSILVVKGQVRLCVVSDVRSLPGAHRGPYLHEQMVFVPASTPEHRCDFDVPATRLEIAVVGALPGVIRPLTFHIEGTSVNARAAMGFDLEPTDGNSGTYLGMPPGTWTVRAESGWIAPAASQTVEITATAPAARVEVLAEPAGIVAIRLRAANGREFAPPASTLPRLRTGGRVVEATSVRRYARGAASWGYVSVPLGPAEVLLEDREVEGQCVFLPFDAQAPRSIDVVLGDHNPVEIFVEPRAQVELRAVDEGGSEDLQGRVSVQWGARSIASIDRSRPSRWHSFLPPGEYRIVVERNGVQKEQLLHVARENVQLRLRP